MSFDLLVGPGIAGAAHKVCYSVADRLNLSTDDAVQKQCIFPVEEHITAVLLANKIVERTVSKTVSVKLFFTRKSQFLILFLR